MNCILPILDWFAADRGERFAALLLVVIVIFAGVEQCIHAWRKKDK